MHQISILSDKQVEDIKKQWRTWLIAHDESSNDPDVISAFVNHTVKGMIEGKMESIIAKATEFELKNHKGVFSAMMDQEDVRENMKKGIRARFTSQRLDVEKLLKEAIARICSEVSYA